MERQPLITWRDVDHTPQREADIRERIDHLEQRFDHILRCEVVVERPHKRHNKGDLYHLRIRLTVPGHELVVSRDPPHHQAHEDLSVAIRDAFDAAERRLKREVAKLRRDVKQHETAPDAVVAALNTDEAFGFLRTPEGRELWFHRSSVVDDAFDALEVGDHVRFVEGTADPGDGHGPQASTVHPAR